MTNIQVLCVNKDSGNHENPHLAIWNFGWLNTATGERGNCNLASMVSFVEKGGYAFTKDLYGNVAKLVVSISAHGHKYVQTKADGKHTNNLLTLDECPL